MKMPLIALAVLLALPGLAAAQPSRLDVSRVQRIEITGDAAALVLTAQAGGPMEARLMARRSGWFSRWYSSWFYNDCRTSSRMWVEGAVLHVDVETPSFLEASDCTVELTAQLPPGVSVDIALQAVQARLDGRFGALAIDTRAGNVEFAGAVEQVDVRGTALRARLDAGEGAPRAVSFAVGSLDAEIALGAGARVGWQVDAKAALVDTALPNDPTGATRIAVSADYVRLSIR